jgi:hypothetical protein
VRGREAHAGSLIASVAAASPEGALARLQALASLAMTADPAASPPT